MKNAVLTCYLCKAEEQEITEEILRRGTVALQQLGWRPAGEHGYACPACAIFLESVQAGERANG